MKIRLLLLLMLISGASWAGVTAFGTAQAREAYEQVVEQLDGLAGLAVRTESYSSGLLTSTAITQVRVSASRNHGSVDVLREAANAPIAFRLRHIIEHLPLALSDSGIPTARIVTTLVEEAVAEPVRHFVAAFAGKPPFVLESQVDLAGGSTHLLAIAEADWSTPAGAGRFAGARYRIEIEPAGAFAGSGQFTRGALPLPISEHRRLEYTEAAHVFSGELEGDDVFNVRQSLHMASLSLTDPTRSQPIRANDLTVELDTQLTDQQLQGTMFLVSNAVDAPVPIERLSLEVVARNLSVTDTVGWQSLVGLSGSRPPTDSTSADPASPVKAAHAWSDLARNILVPGTAATVELSLGNRKGDLNTLTELTFRGDGSDGGFASMTVLGDLLAAVQATMTLDADADTFDGTPLAALLASPLASQAVDFDGTTYRSKLALTDSGADRQWQTGVVAVPAG